MNKKTTKENKKNAKKNSTPTINNYYALLAVIFNTKLSVDDAIRYFHL